MQRIVLAYSGSPTAIMAIPRLAERHGAEVVTLTLDVGQGRELEETRARALAIGAVRAHVIDVREELARRSILAALQSVAPDVRAACPDVLASLIAKHLVDIARIEDTTMVATGTARPERSDGRSVQSGGWGPRELRHDDHHSDSLEATLRALDPSLTVVATPRLRSGQVDPLVSVSAPTRRADRTIWGRIIEWASPGESSSEPALSEVEGFFQLTRDRTRTPDAAAHAELEFDRGVPVRINGVDMPLIELVESLETIAGAHGVGRFDLTRPAADGHLRRTIGETPAARALDAALDELRGAGLAGDVDQLPAIRLQFLKGDCRVVGHRAANVPTPALQSGAARGVGVGASVSTPALQSGAARGVGVGASVSTPALQSGAARGVGVGASVSTPALQSGAARGVGVGPHAIKQSWPLSRAEPALTS